MSIPGKTSARYFPWYLYVLAPLAFLAVSLTLVWYASSNSLTQNVVMGDRALLLTAPDVLEQMNPQHTYNPRAEVVHKDRLPRGGRSLTYRYVDEWVHIDSEVYAELDEAAAKNTFETLSTSAVTHEGQTLEPREWPSVFAERAVAGALLRDSKTEGLAYLALKKNHVVLYRIEGAALVSATVFERLVQQRLPDAVVFSEK